jgi:hypothetical protein
MRDSRAECRRGAPCIRRRIGVSELALFTITGHDREPLWRMPLEAFEVTAVIGHLQ